MKADAQSGDVTMLPAGVAHCMLASDTDDGYLGLYPNVRRFGGLPHVYITNIAHDSPQ